MKSLRERRNFLVIPLGMDSNSFPSAFAASNDTAQNLNFIIRTLGDFRGENLRISHFFVILTNLTRVTSTPISISLFLMKANPTKYLVVPNTYESEFQN